VLGNKSTCVFHLERPEAKTRRKPITCRLFSRHLKDVLNINTQHLGSQNLSLVEQHL